MPRKNSTNTKAETEQTDVWGVEVNSLLTNEQQAVCNLLGWIVADSTNKPLTRVRLGNLVDALTKTEDSQRPLTNFIAHLRLLALDPKGHEGIEWLRKAVQSKRKR